MCFFLSKETIILLSIIFYTSHLTSFQIVWNKSVYCIAIKDHEKMGESLEILKLTDNYYNF